MFSLKLIGLTGLLAAGLTHTTFKLIDSSPQSAETSTQQVVSKLLKGSEDVFITVISDSTAYTSSYLTVPSPVRWVSRFGTALGAKFPAYTVKMNEWDDATKTYLGWATLSAGGGAQTVWISNASFSGVSTQYVVGSNFSPMVLVTNPDLVIISHGHNEGALSSTWASDMVALTEEVGAAVSGASILLVGQNPELAPAVSPGNQALRVARYSEIAGRRGYGFLNIYQAFMDNPGGAAALVNADGIHPNDAGSQLWADELAKAFVFRQYGAQPSRQRSGLATPTIGQLVLNGDFSVWDNTLPAHWGLGAAATFTKDTTNFESINGYGLSIATAAASAFVFQTLPLQLVKGKCVTVAARVFVAAGQPQNAGRLFISDNLGNTQSTQTTWGQGAFRWKVIQRCFDPAITTAQVRLYGDASTTSGAATFDRVSVVLGLVPFDVQMVRDGIRAYRVNADFTTAANTSLQAITGLTWTIPPPTTGVTGEAFPFDCYLLYSQGVANVAMAFGTQSSVTSANLNVAATMRTGAFNFTTGTLVGQTANSPIAVVSATPSATATVFSAELHGVLEQSATTLNSLQILVSTTVAADAVTVKRGSYCVVKFN